MRFGTPGLTSRPAGPRIHDARSRVRAGVGTRERETGEIKLRTQVRTDHEQIRVPKRREEISFERALVEGWEASEAEIGEDEVSVSIAE